MSIRPSKSDNSETVCGHFIDLKPNVSLLFFVKL